MLGTPSPWRRVFLPFAVGYFFSYLLRNVNAVIAPDLARELPITAADLGLLTAAYLFAFGAFQLPLGLLLDRYGPRRVEAALLLVAATGCALFAAGADLTELALARALIGLGVSACLMASFKAFSLWFDPSRQASLNAAVMAAGGLGALAATTPLAALLPIVGWRAVFFAIAALGVVAAAGIATSPEKDAGGSGETPAEQLRALAGILKSRVFWRFAPQGALATGSFIALQGLWAVPWLMQFNGYTRDEAAFHLLLTSGAMLAGFLLLAVLVAPLARAGVPPQRILIGGLGAGIGVLALIVVDIGATQALWPAMGLVFTVSNLAYALLCSHFPANLSGRVNTALNLAVFVGAFGVQWGIGVLVDAFGSAGVAPRDAFRWTFSILLALQAASYAWFVVDSRREAARTRADPRPDASADRVTP